MDKYVSVFCPEVGDFFLCKKEDIHKEYDKKAKYIGKDVSFYFYNISKDGSIYICDQGIMEDDLILVKDDKEIQQVVELFIYTCDKGWGNQIQRANLKVVSMMGFYIFTTIKKSYVKCTNQNQYKYFKPCKLT